MTRSRVRTAIVALVFAGCAATVHQTPYRRKYGSGLLTPSGGTIVGVTAGSGLTGGGVAGDVTVNVGAGSGVIVSADAVSADTSYVQKRIGGSCTGTNAIQTVNDDGSVVCVAAGGGGGGGTVTSVGTGTGLTGGPITTTGTIALANTAVTAGNYTLPAITVNAQGQLTAASSYAGTSCGAGTAIQLLSAAGAASCVTVGSGTVTSVSTTAPITGGPITTSGTIGLSESSNLRTNTGALDLSTAVVMPGSLTVKDLAGTSQAISTTGLLDDVALGSSTTVIDYTGTADASWGGFVSTGDSRWIYIDNATTHVITLIDKDSSTTAADQIKVPESGSDGFQIPPNSGTWIHYDASSSLWRLSGLVESTCSAGQFIDRIYPDGHVDCSAPTFSGVTGSGTTGDLMKWSGSSTATNYAGSAPAACAAGTAMTNVSLTVAGALTLTCGLTALTNSAGANVVTKSDGTNLVSSSIADDGSTVTTSEPMIVDNLVSMSPGGLAQVNFGYGANADQTWVLNDSGYNGGLTRHRSLQIDNGEASQIALFNGVDLSTTLIGALTVDGNTTLGSSWSNTTTNKGQPVCSGTTPTVTGTGASVVGTNCSGTITLGGSGLSSVTLNFDASHAWSNTPPCTFTWVASSNVAVWISAQSTTSDTIKLATTSIGAINYQCGWGY